MDQTIVDELVAGLRQIFSAHLVSVILYGSAARGTATEESDIDVAILLDGDVDRGAKDRLVDFLCELDLKYDRVFSIIDIDNARFIQWRDVLPFYAAVMREGVVLWALLQFPGAADQVWVPEGDLSFDFDRQVEDADPHQIP
ncbi:MAG: nucleotidyltransferase domain-containing protein [Syntrophomonadaceae bacterium]|nr:nucleotidyltransferase domain-containing protein [Syntrophomonadaceae bacterium]